jgi:beta-N-acetylhexosaminidase
MTAFPRFFFRVFAAAFLLLPFPAYPFCLPAEGEEADPSLSVLAGEMILVGFRGVELDDDAPVLRALASGRAGGVVLFSRDVQLGGDRNIRSPSQVRRLVARLKSAAPGPLFVAVDQEGGKVQRLSPRNGFPGWPSALEMGRGPARDTRRSAADMGRALAGAGFNLNFAPVVDLHRPDSPVIGDLERAFHADAAAVAEHAAAFAAGMGQAGVLCALKHFPGHGGARDDTHTDPADVTATWDEEELLPYRALLASGFNGMIMAGHVTLRRFDDLPASLSPAILTGMLRRDMGWDGVIVTDDLQMEAIAGLHTLKETIALAVAAGADVLLFGNNTRSHDENMAATAHSALMELVAEGRVTSARIRESWRRIRNLKRALP